MQFMKLVLAAMAAVAASAVPLAAKGGSWAGTKTGVSRRAIYSPFPSTPAQTAGSPSNGTSSGKQQVVYWGQGTNDRPLSEYCKPTEGIDTVVLAFIAKYGGSTFSGNFGDQCQIGSGSSCASLESDVNTCKQNGKKIYVSIGGGTGQATLNSQSDAESAATTLFNAFADPAVAKSSQARPLGQAFVDGFDFDIESNPGGNTFYPAMIAKLRQLFAGDAKNKYAISGAPQCPIPEPNMGEMIAKAKFDQLFIQFYNNPACSADVYKPGNPGGFDLDQWNTEIGKGQSQGARLFIGLPASPNAATGKADGSHYFVQPDTVQSMVQQYGAKPYFGGIMLWEAGESDGSKSNGCTYAQNMRSILDKGEAC